MVVVLTFVGAAMGPNLDSIFGFFAALDIFESLSSESLRISCLESIAVVVSTLVGAATGRNLESIFGFFAALEIFEAVSLESLHMSCWLSVIVVVLTSADALLGFLRFERFRFRFLNISPSPLK